MKVDRSAWFAALALFLFALLTRQVIFYLVPDGQINDDASYVLRTLKLVAPEKFSRLTDPSHYAIGWPLILAPFFEFSHAGEYFKIGRVLSTLFTSLTAVALFFVFFRRTGSRLFGLGIALLFLHAPQVMTYGSSLMAEPFYQFLVVACLAGYRWAGRDWQFAVLGLLAGWCLSTRTEGLAVVLALLLALGRQGRRGANKTWWYLGGLLGCVIALRLVFASQGESSRWITVTDYFVQRTWGEVLTYPLRFLWYSFQVSGESVLGLGGGLAVLCWAAILAVLAYRLWQRGGVASWPVVLGDPALLWIVLFPAVLSGWPYFSPRYWPLWTVWVLALVAGALPSKPRLAVLLALLLLQLPSAWKQYQLGPLAARFQHEIYLPYYRNLAQGQKVLTLNWSRVEALALVPTAQPLMLTDFQSLPIGMAHQGCDLIEWEVRDRNLTSSFGDKARLYPPHALEGLRQSPCFELVQANEFSETYRLLADPEKLKAAGSRYSQALQTADPNERLRLLSEAVALAPDLPEAQSAWLTLRRERDPENTALEAQLQALHQRYPFLRDETSRSLR